MARYYATNIYLTKGYGVASPDSAARGREIYVSLHPNRREAEIEADRLNGDTFYAEQQRADAERLAAKKARGPVARDRNRYPGVCHKCGAQVPAGEGWLYRYSGANANLAGIKRNLKSQQDQFTIKVRCEGCGSPTR